MGLLIAVEAGSHIGYKCDNSLPLMLDLLRSLGSLSCDHVCRDEFFDCLLLLSVEPVSCRLQLGCLFTVQLLSQLEQLRVRKCGGLRLRWSPLGLGDPRLRLPLIITVHVDIRERV